MLYLRKSFSNNFKGLITNYITIMKEKVISCFEKKIELYLKLFNTRRLLVFVRDISEINTEIIKVEIIHSFDDEPIKSHLVLPLSFIESAIPLI